MRSLAPVALLVAIGTLPACTLYFTDDDDGGDEPPCAYDGGSPRDIAWQELRNPETGQCEPTGGGPYPCDGVCGPCYETTDGALSLIDWAACYGSCEGRAELDCQGTSGCRAAYAFDATNDGPAVYQGCWGTAPSGPVQGGGCQGLGAQDCSRHDDCSPVHSSQWVGGKDLASPVPPLETTFLYCIDEVSGGCYSDGDCGPTESCTASTECMSPPGCDPGRACPDVCYGRCVADPGPACESVTDELTCSDRGECLPIYIGEECECTPNSCSCEELTFDRCVTR